ncbi:long-chain-fatty-acid--CoA ligase [Nitrosomonas supralitoralis]|uniref:Long-chain fatty acid--CoA ligase n=1 Tax=Nitrosomonas supralitoralis TaxID=2116706 RepID=A0A2P7NZ95_9PROT|nr:long-chain-fatty-acid--CoA ligase [Nitrosomonas supralitoralis]PSJ18785.1 long-chain fatty acid--CoA ligase [Nitrosomonas supralitoralis]
MTSYPLLLKQLWHTPLANAADQEIIYRDRLRLSYYQVYTRIEQFCAALATYGLQQNDVIAVMDHDSHRYLECYFAIPMYGATMMTVNTKLTPTQIAYTLNHSRASMLLLHADFIPIIESIHAELPGIQKYIVMADGTAVPQTILQFDDEYECWLANQKGGFNFSDFDENTRATIFYTTGTTGMPKGVYYTHRQLVLHTLAAGMALTAPAARQRFHSEDIYMPLTPMFHVHAWGIPYIVTLLGLKQVYPGRYAPDMLLQLIREEQVTCSHCVPTLLKMILTAARASAVDLRGWKVVVGGSALPQALARQALEMGVDCFAGYGLSETAPILTLAQLNTTAQDSVTGDSLARLCCAGRAIPLVDLQIIDQAMQLQAHDGQSSGEIVVRAPWLTQGYLDDTEASVALWHHDYLHTQDIGIMDPNGYLYITDRLKDVIKVAGEWVSSLELENTLTQVAGVNEVAVIGVPDKRWGERPLALLIVDNRLFKESAAQEQVRLFVEHGSISKHALLTRFKQVEKITKTSVGKIDKKALRAEHAATQ